VNLELYPSDKTTMHVRGSYTQSQGQFSAFEMDLPDEVVGHGDYDYSIMRGYSDLDQSAYSVAVGGSYSITENVGIFADVSYADYSDDEIWVYGDQSGDWIDAMIGATLTF
jgi:hypothetical protein